MRMVPRIFSCRRCACVGAWASSAGGGGAGGAGCGLHDTSERLVANNGYRHHMIVF